MTVLEQAHFQIRSDASRRPCCRIALPTAPLCWTIFQSF